jgi:hypothetical protein
MLSLDGGSSYVQTVQRDRNDVRKNGWPTIGRRVRRRARDLGRWCSSSRRDGSGHRARRSVRRLLSLESPSGLCDSSHQELSGSARLRSVEDLVDHDDLRHGPVLEAILGRSKQDDLAPAPLAGKGTLNRLEHAVLPPIGWTWRPGLSPRTAHCGDLCGDFRCRTLLFVAVLCAIGRAGRGDGQ